MHVQFFCWRKNAHVQLYHEFLQIHDIIFVNADIILRKLM